MKRWRQILLGLIALTLAPTLYAANPCATGGALTMRDGSGQGGTGLRPEGTDGSGQGGTGLSPQLASDGDGSGSGGTGQTVEVEGVITGFASICVNGLELHYHPTTPVSIYGRAASADDLEVGQVVRALAKGRGDQLAVQRVQVRHLLIAPVQELGPGKLRALGRSISLNPGMVLPASLAPGVKVAVSGFAGAHGRSVATRVDVVPATTPDSLTGEVQRNTQGKLMIGGVELDGQLPKLSPGDIVRAEGSYAQGRMVITRIEREERALSADRVVIQGLVRHVDKSGLDIGGRRFLIDSQTRGKQTLPREGERAIIDATRERGLFRARDVETQAAPPENSMGKPAGDKTGGKNSASQRTHHDKEPSPKEEQTHRAETDSGSSKHEAKPPEKVEPAERPKLPEKPEGAKKSERVERPEPVERVERPEPVERIERPEPVERVERPEPVERVERPEPVERIERPERVERPEHDD